MALIMILRYVSERWKTLILGKITLSLRQVLTSNTFHLKAAIETYLLTRYKRLDILILFVYGEDYTERYTDVGGARYPS